MSLEINYVDAPEGAQEKMTASAEGGNAFSDAATIPAGVQDIPWATLEPGIWKLDGTMRILPDAPRPGWWSCGRSGAGGTGGRISLLGVTPLRDFILGDSGSTGTGFADVPVIILTLPVSYGATGLTFTFSPATNQWCTEINIRWYSGQNLLIDKNYFPDAPKWELEELVESFDRLEIRLLSTNSPNHLAKIQRIELGRTVLFDARQIISARLVNEVDPTLCELAIDTMTFEMYDPENRSFLPQENQRVELRKDGVLAAVHYITSSTRKARSHYTIESQSAIGLLNDEFLGGMYSAVPAARLLTEILGSFEYELDPTFENATVTGYLPVCSQREALQRVAFAIGAMVTTQGSGRIRLLPIPAIIASKFTQNEILLGGSVTTAPRYAKAEVYAHTYFKTADVENLMDEEEVDGEDVLITFSSPHYDYEITGGEITGSDVNWVTITASGPVTLTAKTYAHNTRAYVKRNPEATAKERGNYISVTEATLIHPGNAQEAVERLYAAVQRRQTVSQDVVVTGQKAGQITSSMTPWGTITRGFLSSMEHTMVQNGHIAAIKIQGVEVSLDSVWLYSGELFSGGMEVLY